MTTSSSAVVLFSHGSRDPLWRAPLEAVATHIQAAQPHRPVACAYLELCEPNLGQVVQTLVDKGAAAITVVPMFLGTGKHAREDLPLLVGELRTQHPGITFHVQQAIGEDTRMTALMAHIACETPAT
ncbi:cobalamin biosynthesis protein CbiX [Acidovorax sp. 1608163]|uniref:sirohydrochlorin chelatase n=1 Tax=Acidovorax sp. 1608163 TaxID=2478662 RepID=UPI000EF70058|nr:CbiX/SirB N-terminal domain-containing protein [Acidovorax sp. 1608163]AYM96255.1 cobalamin biosynthesis protein CbiX [Acidovorax sp. 1608163]